MLQEYNQELQKAKLEVFKIFKANNNLPLSISSITAKLKYIELGVDLEDVVSDKNPYDEFEIECHNPMVEKKNWKYKIKTPDIRDKQQLIQFLRECNGSYISHKSIFESCYTGMSQDLEDLKFQDMLITAEMKDDSGQLYLIQDQLFRNKIEGEDFKAWIAPELTKIINETSQDIKKQNELNSQNRQGKEQIKKGTQIVNFWIPDIQKYMKQ